MKVRSQKKLFLVSAILVIKNYLKVGNIYGDVFSDNIRKFYKKIVVEMPEIPKEKLSALMMEHFKNWEVILEEQINHFSAFSENLFKVPSNIVLENNMNVHEAVINYSVKDDSKMEKMIEELNKRIEKV